MLAIPKLDPCFASARHCMPMKTQLVDEVIYKLKHKSCNDMDSGCAYVEQAVVNIQIGLNVVLIHLVDELSVVAWKRWERW